MTFDQDNQIEHFDEEFRADSHTDEDFDAYREDYVGTNVCGVVNYSINLFGLKVNIWILMLVIIVISGAIFYQRNKRLPNMNDIQSTFSSTSDMDTIKQQMGGFISSPSLSSTPNFIKNLRY